VKKDNILYCLKPPTKLCTDFYVFDTETGKRKKDGYIYWQLNAQPKSFIFGVIYGLNYTKVIYSLKEFHETLLEPRFKGRKVFAHNAQYDLNVLYGNIYDLDAEAIFNGKFICASNGNCTFADSMNVFIGASVKDLGAMQGMPKEQLGDSDYRSKGITKDDINYCIRDCQIVWDALVQAFEFAGDIRITQAGLSMTYFRRYHQPYHIEYNKSVFHFWDSYFGGRCEVFKLGKTHSKVIDVNSMYPYAMKHCVFPNPKFLKVELNFPLKKLKKYLEWYEGCAYCTIIHKESDIGYLPYKQDNKLKFPVGEFKGCWNFNELKFAIDSGIVKVLHIEKIVYAEKMQSPFVTYVDTLQEKKLKAELSGDDLGRSIAKYYSNSLYGKFGQRITEESIYLHDITKQWNIILEYQKKGMFVKLQMFNKNRNDAFLITKTSKKMDLSYCIPSFASYVTSYSRVMLLKKLIELKNNGVVYCDTDSVFFEIDNGIVSETNLGGWKIENKIVTEIKDLKNYKYINTKNKEIWRVKGVPVNNGKTVKIFNDDDTEKTVKVVEQISDTEFVYYNLVKSKEALKRNIEAGQLTKRTKKIKSNFDKRIILAGGKTKPIKIK
jgi:hypothetical protein